MVQSAAEKKARKRDYQRAWRRANVEKARAQKRARYAANKDHILRRARNWRKANPLSVLLKASRSRALERGIAHDLDLEWFVAKHAAQNGRCAITGVPFDSAWVGHGKKNPLGMSLDRVEPAKGYVKENCRLVCFAVNAAMSDWGDGVFAKLAYGLVELQRRTYA